IAESDPDELLAKAIAAFRFYLQSTIWTISRDWARLASGATNYLGLVTDVKRYWRDRGPACFVTFNYDRLLEDGCAGADITYPNLETYSHGPYPLFRPHGAVHWAHPTTEITLRADRTVENQIVDAISTIQVKD